MKDYIKKNVQNTKQRILNPSEYIKNVASVFTATTIAQFLPILTAPILTRIYTPADYGLLGVMISIAGIVSVFTTLGYANAIIISPNNNEANEVVALCFKILLLIGVIIAIVFFVLQNWIASVYNIHTHKYLLLLIPLSVLLSGMGNIIGFVANRNKLFKTISVNRIIASITTAIVSIAMGLLFRNVIGLIIGYFIGQFINSIVLYFSVFYKNKINATPILNFYKIKTGVVFKKYIHFFKYYLPSDFINIFSNQIPIFLISSMASAPQAAVGFYNMGNRILGLPIGLISNSIGEVFKQRAANDYNNNGTCRPIFLKTLKVLFLTSILPFSILIFFGADIFAFAFGEIWRTAGKYSQIMGALFMFRFIVSPLSYVFFVAQKQKEDLMVHLLFIVLGFGSMYIGFAIHNDIKYALSFFVISYCLIYAITLMLSYKFSKNTSFYKSSEYRAESHN